MSKTPENDAHAAGETPSNQAPVESPGGLPDLGGMAGLGDLLESAQQAFSAQAEAAQQVVEGRAGGGVVKASMTGGGEIVEVTLAPEVVDPDEIEMLQDLIVAALRDAAQQVADLQRQALGAFGGIDAGDLGGMFGGALGAIGDAGDADPDADDR